MIILGYLGYGKYYEQLHQPEEAIKYYEKGIQVAELVNSLDLQVEISDRFIQNFRAQKDWEKAFYYLNFNLEKKNFKRKNKHGEDLKRKSIQRNFKKEESKIESSNKKITSSLPFYV
jgi:tetratricopeptide (TPR) repeat protein